MHLIFCVMLLLAGSGMERDSLWVNDFTNETGGSLPDVDVPIFMKGLHSSLSVKLSRHFRVVERDKLKNVFDEITLGDQSLTRRGTRAKLGQLTGAKFLLTGSIIAFDTDTMNTTAHGIKMAKTSTEMVLTYKLIHIETGEVHWGDEITVTHVQRDTGNKQQQTTGIIRKLSRKCADKVLENLKEYFEEKGR